MSRDIKFRAWDLDHKEFVYISQTEDGEMWVNNGVSTTVMPYHKCELEQYTDLKDKNGKEIYEGDIVEQFVCGVHQFKGKKCGRSTIWQVRWNKKECCFELHYLNGSLFGDSMMSDGDEYEVIGNIHENPELLGGEK